MRDRSFIRRSLLCAGVLIGCGLSAAATATAQTFDQVALDGMVPQMSSTLLASRLKQNNSILVFDVREREEFLVSRLPGAMHAGPSTAPDQFLRRVASRTSGAIFVFYCAAGARSAELSQAVYHDLMERGAAGVYILKGGFQVWQEMYKGNTKYVENHNQTYWDDPY